MISLLKTQTEIKEIINIINFYIIHHECRGKQLNCPIKEYKTFPSIDLKKSIQI